MYAKEDNFAKRGIYAGFAWLCQLRAKDQPDYTIANGCRVVRTGPGTRTRTKWGVTSQRLPPAFSTTTLE